MGYSINGGMTATRALEVGRNQSVLQNAIEQFRVLTQGTRVALAQQVNQTVLRAYLFALAPAVRLRAQPTARGRSLDVAPTERAITRVLVRDGPSTVQLKFKSIPRLVTRRSAKPHRPK